MGKEGSPGGGAIVGYGPPPYPPVLARRGAKETVSVFGWRGVMALPSPFPPPLGTPPSFHEGRIEEGQPMFPVGGGPS